MKRKSAIATDSRDSKIIQINFYILTYNLISMVEIIVVLFCAQHAAVANCEQTVGDNITLLNVPFSFNDRFTEQI